MLSWNSPKRSGYYSVVAVYLGSVVAFLRFKPQALSLLRCSFLKKSRWTYLSSFSSSEKLGQEIFVGFLGVLKAVKCFTEETGLKLRSINCGQFYPEAVLMLGKPRTGFW